MKFAQVGYGSKGQGAGASGTGYTYLVNDNVRSGDKIQPIVHHAKNQAIFSTHGKVLTASKNLESSTSVRGDLMKHEAIKQLEMKGYLKVVDGKVVGIETGKLTYQKTAKEMGLQGYSKEQQKAVAGQNILDIATSPNNKSRISKGIKTQEAVAKAMNTSERQAQEQINAFNKGI